MEEDSELIEIFLPGIKLCHLKRSIKFLYTGQLRVNKAEEQREHFLYHIDRILREILRVDAEFNIPSEYLEAPNNGDNDHDPHFSEDNNNPGDHDEQNGEQGNNNFNHGQISNLCNSDGSGIQNTRQNTAIIQTIEENIIEHSQTPATVILENTSVVSAFEEETRENTHQQEEVIQEFIVVDVNRPYGEEVQEANYLNLENAEEYIIGDGDIHQTFDPVEAEGNSDDIVEMEQNVPTPEIFDLLYSDDEEEEGGTNQLDAVWNLQETPMNEEISEENSDMSTSRLDPTDQNRIDSDQSEANQVDSLRRLHSGSRIQKKTKKSNVRKYNHIPWTMSGIKRAATEAVIKEESAEYICDLCNAKFAKAKSLEIHCARTHNKKANVACPLKCGKMLTSSKAIKKHLLSHRPEEEWPHECPLCHKKFQARGDIPKHLKTKLHENDNIPAMGTKERIQSGTRFINNN